MKNTKNGCAKAIKTIIVFLLISLAVTAFILHINYKNEMSNAKLLQISSQDVKTMKCDELQRFLENQGFTNISVRAMEDLHADQVEMSGMVNRVKINHLYVRSDSFDINKKYPLDSEIEIEFHSMKKASPPISSNSIMDKGYNYNSLKEKFEEAGFTEIELNPCPALVTGMGNDVGRVVAVMIGSDEEFGLEDKYEINEKVIISYLTFKIAISADG